MARFSFTPLVAARVEAGPLTSTDVTIIGAVLMAGYTVGAMTAASLAARFGRRTIMVAALTGVPSLLVLEGFATGSAPLIALRFVTGALGAFLMVLGPSLVLKGREGSERSRAGNIAFTGVGLGILVSGLGVATLTAEIGVSMTTFGLAGLAVMLALFPITWLIRRAPTEQMRPSAAAPKEQMGLAIALLMIAYGVDAVAFIPHSVFLSDFVAGERGLGSGWGGTVFAALGLGAALGPSLCAVLRHGLGGGGALVAGFLIKGVGAGLAVVTGNPLLLCVSAALVGTMIPGIAMLVSLRLADWLAADRQTVAWGMATSVFAIGQAVGAALFAWLFTLTNGYLELIALEAALLLVGAVLVVYARDRRFT